MRKRELDEGGDRGRAAGLAVRQGHGRARIRAPWIGLQTTLPDSRCPMLAGTTETPRPAATRVSTELIWGGACRPMIGLKPARRHAATICSRKPCPTGRGRTRSVSPRSADRGSDASDARGWPAGNATSISSSSSTSTTTSSPASTGGRRKAASSAWPRSASSRGRVFRSVSATSSFGKAARKARIASTTDRTKQVEGVMPSSRRPSSPRLAPFTTAAARSASERTRLASRRNSSAGLGQLDGAARPVQERPAQLAFQVLDLLRERRLGDAEAFRGAPEVPLLGDGDEVAEVAQLHA